MLSLSILNFRASPLSHPWLGTVPLDPTEKFPFLNPVIFVHEQSIVSRPLAVADFCQSPYFIIYYVDIICVTEMQLYK